MLPTVLNKTFEKDFKLINNITFGETMENLRKRIHVRPVNNTADFSQINQSIQNLVFFTLFLNSCKLLMYEFHYNHLKIKFSANLLFADTEIQFMKLKQMMVMKIFLEIKICLSLVIIHNIQNVLKLVNKKVKNLFVK